MDYCTKINIRIILKKFLWSLVGNYCIGYLECKKQTAPLINWNSNTVIGIVLTCTSISLFNKIYSMILLLVAELKLYNILRVWMRLQGSTLTFVRYQWKKNQEQVNIAYYLPDCWFGGGGGVKKKINREWKKRKKCFFFRPIQVQNCSPEALV